MPASTRDPTPEQWEAIETINAEVVVIEPASDDHFPDFLATGVEWDGDTAHAVDFRRIDHTGREVEHE